MKTCALCQKPAKLCQSHIIPEFCYTATYDEKGRASAVNPADPSDQRFVQKGVRSELLCEACERLINDRYEKPFKAYWYDGDALAPLRAGQQFAYLDNIAYGPFKLFHLSVLFRASVSDHANHHEVELGPHKDAIRQMVLKDDPGEEWRYPIMCSAIEGEGGGLWDEFVGPVHRVKHDRHWAYHFAFGGAQWVYVVSSHQSKATEGRRLTKQGRLRVVKQPYMAIDHHRDLQRAHSKAASHPSSRR